jgi:hypothetical protein
MKQRGRKRLEQKAVLSLVDLSHEDPEFHLDCCDPGRTLFVLAQYNCLTSRTTSYRSVR